MDNIDQKAIIEECLKEAFILQGQFISLTEERKNVIAKVEKAKKWLSKQPDYVKFIQHLQSIIHEKNIGAFSELLSYFVRDVLKKEKDIILDLYTYHNLPALRIEAVNNGERENIYEGNGGSVANIVSTGLRLIALSRMTNRKFIILDEPDCWLKPDHVPLFAKIIGEIAQKLQIQTVIISHHHWKYFKDFGRVIELKQEGPHLTTEIIYDTPFEEGADAKSIKKIILRKLMSHYETHYELHPYLTCIIGENDIGKSVIATAMKSVAYADSSDSYIMHHETEAQILIEFDSKQILWQRFLKTTEENPQKVKFSLYENNTLVASEFSANNTPKFISETLNISTVEDIDLHIGNQKQPVFLLSSDVKPNDRAKILSLGKESLLIQKIMENIKNKTRQLKQSVREGEERFNSIEQQINLLSNIDEIIDKAQVIKTNYYIFEKQVNKTNELGLFLSAYNKSYQSTELTKIEQYNIQEPDINNIDELESFLVDFSIYLSISKIADIKHNIKDYNIVKTVELSETIVSITNSYKMKNVDFIDIKDDNYEITKTDELAKLINLISKLDKFNCEPLTLVDNDLNLANSSELTEIINSLKENQAVIDKLNTMKNEITSSNAQMDNEATELLAEMDSLCPTCNQHVSKEHFLKGL